MRHIGDGVGPAAYALTVPFVLFCAYQMTFAVITPALITGATADRFKFKAYAAFIGLWLVLVYAPVAHWVFGGGWLAKLGALDFAGGAVVHINAGAAALAVVIVLGKRKGWPREGMHPHNLPLTLLGTGILWFGWFGFNAGSALASNGVAARALMNTFLAASAAMIGWLIVEGLKDGKPTTLGAASGAVAGLVAITPCAGYVGGMAPVYIGLVAGAVCFFAIQLKYRFGYDDSLDVIGVHLVGGVTGALLLGLFADSAINPVVDPRGALPRRGPEAAVVPVRRLGRHLRLQLRRLVGPGQGARHGHRAAGEPRRRGRGPRHQPARRVRLQLRRHRRHGPAAMSRPCRPDHAPAARPAGARPRTDTVPT